MGALSTELEDVSEVEYRRVVRLERVLLVGCVDLGNFESSGEDRYENSHNSPKTAGSAGGRGSGATSKRTGPGDLRGVGKRPTKLRDLVQSSGADTVICDGELSPGQLRTLEDIVKVKKLWTERGLILDIFAQHARSREGKAQVSLAQMQYLLPRLRGWGESLSRQAGGRAGGATGGVGTRGPGETKIETDRRRIRSQMAKIRAQLRTMDRTQSDPTPRASEVGCSDGRPGRLHQRWESPAC